MGNRSKGYSIRWRELVFFSLQGASFVELDVQLTKDHVPIIFHDDFVALIESDQVCTKDVLLASFSIQFFPMIPSLKCHIRIKFIYLFIYLF